MPINDPIRGKKVAPASLAFESGRAPRGNTSATYQSSVTTSTAPDDFDKLATDRELRRSHEIAQGNVIDAEQRAKHHVGAYSESFEWDFGANVTITTETHDTLGFDHEVIRAQGAYMSGTVSTNDASFEYHCPKGQTGVWWYYCHIQMVLTVGMQVTSARLSLFKNGIQYRVLDAMDMNMSGDDALYIQDLVLGKGCQCATEKGDVITFRLYLESDLPSGDQLLLYPTSVYGYCGGFRLRCDTTEIDSPRSGDTYTFVT